MLANKKRNLFLVIAVVLLSSFIILKKDKRPTLFFIGDSTVKNGRGDGGGNMWGWGDLMTPLFDTSKIVDMAFSMSCVETLKMLMTLPMLFAASSTGIPNVSDIRATASVTSRVISIN